ncbi:NB-ARC domain protein [Mycoavidus cysteinexigens]|uniref:NB-ARC domain protein n=1 Tax=Mycoavidus cysteinexigens TaxID=1553431 RepID=A0A2Z6EWB5_9BURK|nr:NACHT domain-containing protein [Mycoavidus cysteinexigens]BBE09750.1 NB-ARC domain protein [Mycoavidus cysteinexigens]GLR02383.1 hypothetical protein GCM10007934_22010 [Mycoavidus cysteinexigens]
MLSKIVVGLGIQSSQPKLAAFEQGKEHLEKARIHCQRQAYKLATEEFNKAKEAFKKAVFNAVNIENKQESEALLGQSYLERGDTLHKLKKFDKARLSYEKARPYLPKETVEEKLRLLLSVEPQSPSKAQAQHLSQLTHQFALSALSAANPLIAAVASLCFKQDPSPAVYGFDRNAEIDDLHNTRHLAYCLQEDGLSEERRKALKKTAVAVLEAFSQKGFKTLELIQEIVPLAMVGDLALHRGLISLAVDELASHRVLVNRDLARGLAAMIRLSPSSGLNSGDLTRILNVFKIRLETAHRERNDEELQSLLQAVTQLLDGMVQRGVRGIDRIRLQEPLNVILKELSESPGILGWQAGYARQALAHISNNESKLHEIWRHTFNTLGVLTYFSGGVIKAGNGDIEPDKFYDALAKFFEVKGSIEQGQMRRANWYLALRVSDYLLETNQLMRFEAFVKNNQCGADPNFLQGICHRLEQIACTHPDEHIRQGAVGFLSKLSQSNGQERLSEVAQSAKHALDRIERGHHAEVLPVWDLSGSQPGESILLKEELLKLKEARLKEAQRTQLQPDREPLAILGDDIQKMRNNYLLGLQKDETVKDALNLYVAPEGKAVDSGESGERFDLSSKLNAFLESDKKVFLLLGEAGSGKSTFNRYLARDLWEKYEQADSKEDERIPVFIPLTTLEDPNKNLLTEYFTEEGFSKEQIQQLRQKRRFIFILDGYDEIKHRQRAFYTDNKLDKWGAKVIISSRPEYLGRNYDSKFYPSGQAGVFEKCELAPFSKAAIRGYVKSHIRHAQDPKWNAEQYESALSHPDLQALIGNPFLLKIVLDVLPSLGSKKDSSNRNSYTRGALYEQFAKNWFERSKSRLQGIRLTEKEQETFDRLAEGDFIEDGIHFSQEFALALYKKQVLVATYSKGKGSDGQDWSHFLSSDDEKTRLLRFNAPLSRQGDQYRFIHKSLRDYFVARVLWEELENSAGLDTWRVSEPLDGLKNVRRLWDELKDSEQVDREGLLNRFNLVEDAAIQSFLVERVEQDRALVQPLLAWIQASKQTDTLSQGAANAMTILVKAGIQFNGMDLQGIRVPRANLSYGIFDSAQLQKADLREVNFSKSWLREANLSGAQMAEVQFGECSYLQEEGQVWSCAYSPDKKTYAAGLDNGKISVYTTPNWEKIHTLKGHTDTVWSVAYSRDGDQIASGSSDKTVRLWDVKSGTVSRILEGHSAAVFSVVYSPSRDQIASGSLDKTVRLWDVKSGTVSRILEDHTDAIRSVAYSPDGYQIVSGSWDKTVRLWDAKNGTVNRILEGHAATIVSVAYSPNGDQIASGSKDNTVRLWDVKSGAADLTLKGHADAVFSVVYSPRGDQVVSGSLDKTVRLWDAQSGAAGLTLEGHTDAVASVVYSHDGDQIASGSWDNTVRLWDAQSGVAGLTLKGHTDVVRSVAYSPDGDQIVSGSWDKTVRLWDAKSGAAGFTLKGHAATIVSVAYSPDGDQIASGSKDNTVRLWDAKSGTVRRILKDHTDAVLSVAYSRDGDQIASGSVDNTVRLWDVKSGTVRRILKGHTGAVISLAYSPDGDQIASGSWDKTVRLWNAQSGAAGLTLEGHTALVWSVVYSPRRDQIASGSSDNTVRLWDAKSGTVSRILKGHTGAVWSAVYSHDGDQIASGSLDCTVRLWETQTGECQILIQDSGSVASLAWKKISDGDYLGIGSVDKSVRQWELRKEDGNYKAHFNWSTCHNFLTVRGALIGGVEGLSEVNQKLLTQRGAALA